MLSLIVSAPTGLGTSVHQSARIPGRATTPPAPPPEGGTDSVSISSESRSKASSSSELTKEERAAVQKLKARDGEVKAHEHAHQRAAGHLGTSGPTYTYERGPDGQRYAVGGEVRVMIGRGKTPEETLKNAEAGLRAALAPAQPSGQDRAVAAKATILAMEARAEISRKSSGDGDPGVQREDDSEAGGLTPDGERAEAAYSAQESIDVTGLFLVA